MNIINERETSYLTLWGETKAEKSGKEAVSILERQGMK
jgi:hypothetical protein